MLNRHKLKGLLEVNNIQQVELAQGIGKSKAFVSKLLSDDTGASQDTIDAILAFLSKRLRRKVTYEMVFGAPAARAAAEAGK